MVIVRLTGLVSFGCGVNGTAWGYPGDVVKLPISVVTALFAAGEAALVDQATPVTRELMDLVWWGTNPAGGRAYRYGGRLHLTSPDGPKTGLCGLPVARVWRQQHRPAVRLRLCPECCIAAVARLFPERPRPQGVRVDVAVPVRMPERTAEKTQRLRPLIEDG